VAHALLRAASALMPTLEATSARELIIFLVGSLIICRDPHACVGQTLSLYVAALLYGIGTSQLKRRHEIEVYVLYLCLETAMDIVRKAVITAAGRGTRQYPATSFVQKAMLPIVDRDGLTKPVIQIIAEEAFDAGIEKICIVVAPGDESQFRQYFKAMEEDLLPAFAGQGVGA
jgi:hypothetical protein